MPLVHSLPVMAVGLPASLSPADLMAAREIFLTNSLFEFRSVERLDDREFGQSEIAAKIRADYRALT